MKWLFPALLTLFWLFFCSCQCRAEEFPLNEYQLHVNRYISSLANISVDFVELNVTLDGSRRTETEYSLISIPNYFRVKSTMKTSEKRTEAAPLNLGELLRPDGHYLMSQLPNKGFLLRNRERGITSVSRVESGSGLRFLLLPLSRAFIPIQDLLLGQVSGHKLQSSDFHRGGTNDAPKYTFQTRDEINGGTSETSYELNSDWLVTRCTISSRPPGKKREDEISYIMFEGRQLPAKYTSKIAGSARDFTYQVDFRNYKVFEGQPADFSLAHFGLPEMDQHGRGGWSGSLRYVLMAAAALFFALYLIFRHRSRRSTRGLAGPD